MKISLNWLSDYVDVSMPLREMTDLFTRIGLNVEEAIETDTDVVLDLEVTSNRPDCLGHLGVARELAAAAGLEFRPPDIGPLRTRGRVEDLTRVDVLDPDLCPRYTARVIRGVKVAPSPRRIVERLEAVGLRGINNVVDVTNYVLMEYSQPLHSFDHDKLAEGRIVVRRARDGEMLVSIDGTRCRLDAGMCVIADAQKPVAIAGIMGGLDSEVSEQTVNVLIEAAEFDPLTTRRTSRKLGILTESNYRFERGVDPARVEEASRRACQLILELAGGELAEGVADAWARPFTPATVALRPERTNKLLGMNVPPERQAEILDRLGLAPRLEGGRIVCQVPSHRRDLVREADLIEEIARLEGYDKIPVHGRVTHAVVSESLPQQVRRRLGEALAAAGFDEAITAVFVDDQEAARFGFERTVRVDPSARKANNALRPTLLPSLLRACKVNQDAGNAEVSLWELASVFPPGKGALPEEHAQVAMLTTRELPELRGALEAAVERIAPRARLEVREAAVAGLAPGAAAELRLDGEPVGAIGCVDAKVRDAYGLERPVAGATVRFDALLARAQLHRTYQPLPRFPAVQRDLSLIVAEDVTWARLSEALGAVEQPLRAGEEYVTTYTGRPIPPGHKSVTVRLTYRAADRTLRSEEVDQQVAQVVAAMRQALGAELRA